MMMQNYPNYMQPYNPPYQPQFQPVQQGSTIPGRIVDDFNLVGASDVPMDGNASVFMKRDLSEIQVRKWGADGRIYTTSYKPFLEPLNTNVENVSSDNKQTEFEALNEQLQGIQDKLDRLLKPATTKKVNNNAE